MKSYKQGNNKQTYLEISLKLLEFLFGERERLKAFFWVICNISYGTISEEKM